MRFNKRKERTKKGKIEGNKRSLKRVRACIPVSIIRDGNKKIPRYKRKKIKNNNQCLYFFFIKASSSVII